MKRGESIKFPNSVQLFKFCYKVLSMQRSDKINDQDLGNILEFNPSDCSHWKRGEKNVKSVFALAKLAETLHVEPGLLHDLASGASVLDEAFFEYSEASAFKAAVTKAQSQGTAVVNEARERIENFVATLHTQAQFTTAPLYLPEVFRLFSFIQTQPVDMIDRLTRILRSKPGHYIINYKKGDLKAQTRMSMAKDLARIVLQAERARFPELGAANAELLAFEELTFVTNLLLPKTLVVEEMAKLDSRKNVMHELGTLFWAPKALVGYQIQDMFRGGRAFASNRVKVNAELRASA